MELTVLGSGCFAPDKDPRKVRNPSGYALRFGGRIVLLDFGFGNLRQLARAGLDPAKISHAFFTHRHPDHVGDLAALLFHFSYASKPTKGVLRAFGPKGIGACLKSLRQAFKPWLAPARLRELKSGDRLKLDGFTIACLKTPHSTPSLAYRLTAGGKSLVYSGDTGLSPELAHFARGCDLFLLECTMPDRETYSGHLTARQALEMIELSGCKKAVLTHLSEASLRDARKRLPRNVVAAKDLMRIRL